MVKKEKDLKEDNLVKKTKKVKEKKVKEKKGSFFHLVMVELKHVKWPELKEVVKYSAATIAFCLILAGFFSLLNLALSFVKGLFI